MSWKYIGLILNVGDAWLFFKNAFLASLNKHAPFKKFRSKNRYSPWYTSYLSQHKNTMWRTALTSKNPYDLQLFMEVRNRYTQAVKKC